MTKAEIEAGLAQGKTLVIDRKDAPALPICLELEREGKAEQRFFQIDEQSSCVKFRKPGGFDG